MFSPKCVRRTIKRLLSCACRATGTCDFYNQDEFGVGADSAQQALFHVNATSLPYQQFDLNPDLWLPHPEMANATLYRQYAQSMFWAVEVTTGLGDDIIPKARRPLYPPPPYSHPWRGDWPASTNNM